METLSTRLVAALGVTPGLSDRELTDRLIGPNAPQQGVNQVCRKLAESGSIQRRSRADGRIGNYLPTDLTQSISITEEPLGNELEAVDAFSEDEIKRALVAHLGAEGWRTVVAWGRAPGIDILAEQETRKWIIEVKGRGTLSAMRVNYFVGALGELLQRMDDDTAKYSIAFPDLAQYRGLWNRLPAVARRRLGLTALIVGENGTVRELT